MAHAEVNPFPRYRYAKITFKGHDMKRAKSALVVVLSETARFLLCRIVNEAGESTEDYVDKNDNVVDVKRMIEKTAITKAVPYVMNNHYGLLEPA